MLWVSFLPGGAANPSLVVEYDRNRNPARTFTLPPGLSPSGLGRAWRLDRLVVLGTTRELALLDDQGTVTRRHPLGPGAPTLVGGGVTAGWP